MPRGASGGETHRSLRFVSDFGLGKNLASDSSAVTTTTIHAGSFVYASPEQLRDLRSADKRSDTYALGKILQAMLTGELPVQTR
jgi:serine/threonine protein kinase